MIRERIEEKLRAAFQPVFLEVVDESYRHEKIFCGYCNNSLKIFNSVDVKDTNTSLI